MKLADTPAIFSGRGPTEERDNRVLAADVSLGLDLTGKLGLRELFAVFAHARRVYAVDSLAVHVASAVGTPR